MKDKKIGLTVAVMIGLNAMVGAGIVAIPAVLAGSAGPAGILSFGLSVIVVLCMSYAFGKLSHDRPSTAWSYQHPATLYGHKAGLVIGCLYWVGVLVAMGFLVQQAGVWAQHFLPNHSAELLGSIILGTLTLLVLFGPQASSLGQYIIAAVVVLSLMSTAFVCFRYFDVGLWTPFAPYGYLAVLEAAPKAMFSLLGFESIASLATIIRDPKKNVAKACIYSVLVVGALYFIFIVSILGAIPESVFTGGQQKTLVSILAAYLPQHPTLQFFIFLGGLFAIIGTLHSMIWSVTILLFDTLSFVKTPSIKQLFSPEGKSQKLGIIITALLMWCVSLWLHSTLLLDLSVALIAIAYLSTVSLFFRDAVEQRQTKGGLLRLILATVACLGCCLILFMSIAPYFYRS